MLKTMSDKDMDDYYESSLRTMMDTIEPSKITATEFYAVEELIKVFAANATLLEERRIALLVERHYVDVNGSPRNMRRKNSVEYDQFIELQKSQSDVIGQLRKILPAYVKENSKGKLQELFAKYSSRS